MHLIVSTFLNKHRGVEVLSDLDDHDLELNIPVDEAAVALTINKHGKVRIHQSHDAASAGMFLGGLAGCLAGLLVMAPGVGAAIGAAAGGALGAVGSPEPLDGLDKGFLKSLGQHFARNSSALIVLVPDEVAATALEAVRAYEDGTIAEAHVDAATEQAIRDAYQKSMA